MRNERTGEWAAAALFAAALFGISAPLAKVLLGQTAPLPLAGLLYLGSGLGLSLFWVIRRATARRIERHPPEARLRAGDFVWLAGATVCGGIIAPILLVSGLSLSPASSASLLLNLEGVLTVLIAALVFREAVGGRILVAALLVFVGAAGLSWQPAALGPQFSSGSVLIAGACLMWAADNNLTRHLSARDPFAVARFKGLIAGTTTLLLALLFSQPFPDWRPAAYSLFLGAVSYGASLVLFVYALRHLGAARTGVFFGIAPFVGAAVSVIALREPLTPLLMVTGVLMAAATCLLLSEAHLHEHVHEAVIHEHRHPHEEHHEHPHEEAETAHSHEHAHALLVHFHAHVPDLHHRHGH